MLILLIETPYIFLKQFLHIFEQVCIALDFHFVKNFIVRNHVCKSDGARGFQFVSSPSELVATLFVH